MERQALALDPGLKPGGQLPQLKDVDWSWRKARPGRIEVGKNQKKREAEASRSVLLKSLPQDEVARTR
jgi:hypothetical protein